MGNAIRYGKPCLTNLPEDLGKAIFKKILATPAPDRAKMKAESEALLKEMIEEREREDAGTGTEE
jgi:hypothetical protein